jgi:hypothetical protein
MVLQRLQSMFGQNNQLIPIVAAYVAGCDNTIGHDFDSSTVCSNHDRRLHPATIISASYTGTGQTGQHQELRQLPPPKKTISSTNLPP